jgi:hypothetical protein
MAERPIALPLEVLANDRPRAQSPSTLVVMDSWKSRALSAVLSFLPRALQHRLYGSLGPASAVRKIDPANGEVLATIPARTPEA